MPGAQGLTDSDATSGTTTITDLSVTGGTAYYLVVKSGGGTIVNGAYNLELTWKDADDWPTCSEDTYDGKDAWFAFTTAASLASGGTYTIETQNSSADTTIALYKDTNADNAYQSGEYMTCANEVNGSSSITTALQPSTKYYVRVKQPVGGASGAISFGVRNSAVVVNTQPLALACADSGSSLGYAKLVQTLDPGTYYVGWRGGRGSTHYTGSYHITFRDNSKLPAAASQIGCAVATSGNIGSMDANLQAGRNYYVLVKGDGASSNSGSYAIDVADTDAVPDMTCQGKIADSGAPDAYEAFTVSGTKDVTVDLSGSTLDGVYELWQHSGTEDTKLGCGVTTGGTTTVTQQLAPGNYYVKLRGASSVGNAGEQPFEVSVRDDDVQRSSDCSDGGGVDRHEHDQVRSPPARTTSASKPQSGSTGGTYQLSMRDPSFATSGGTQSACTTTRTTDVNVTANHDYYVLVKGSTAADKGQYGLTVTDIGALDTTARRSIRAPKSVAAPISLRPTTTTSSRSRACRGTSRSRSTNELQRRVPALLRRRQLQRRRRDRRLLRPARRATRSPPPASTSSWPRAARSPPAPPSRRCSSRSAITDVIGSVACADGTRARPLRCSRASLPSAVTNGSGQLKAGTYYIAFSGQGTSNGAYALQFGDQDQSAAVVCAGDRMHARARAMTQTLAANTRLLCGRQGQRTAEPGHVHAGRDRRQRRAGDRRRVSDRPRGARRLRRVHA